MARPKNGTSAHSRYRHARAHLADIEARLAALARSRPRTTGKKRAKTRALGALSREARAARGALTKARNAISKATADKRGAGGASQRRRSNAAKKGWAKRRAAKPAPSLVQRVHAQRFLEERAGEVVQIRVASPYKEERSAIGTYWNSIGAYRDTGSTAHLLRFEGRSIYDGLTQRRLPFVTDTALLPEAIAAGQTDFDDLYIEVAWTSAE